MDIEEFIGSALQQITNSVNKNKDLAGFEFRVYQGIEFDLAVTTTSEDIDKSGKSLTGNIKVVSGDTSSNKVKSEKNEAISRIRFTVRYQDRSTGDWN